MKKLVIASMLALSALSASAAEVGLNSVYDTTSQRFGASVSAKLPAPAGFAIAPVATITNVTDLYTRYAVGASFDAYNYKGLTVSVNGGGLYQDTIGSNNGYAAYVGSKVAYALNKYVNMNVGVERVFGQDKIASNSGNVASVGVSVKF